MNFDINVVHMSMDGYFLSKEDITHLNFGQRKLFTRSLIKATKKHLMALYMKCYINGKPISRMLMDGGVVVNLMTYSLFKKLEGSYDDIIKTNMTVNGVGGGEPMGAKCVVSMELTVGSKMLAMTFFIAET
jgi:hypothetical protein